MKIIFRLFKKYKNIFLFQQKSHFSVHDDLGPDFQLSRWKVFWAKILRLYSWCIWRNQRIDKDLQAAIFYGSQKSPKNHTVTKIVEKQIIINYPKVLSGFLSDFQLTRLRVFKAKILRLYSWCIWRNQRIGKDLQGAIFYGSQKSPKITLLQKQFRNKW